MKKSKTALPAKVMLDHGRTPDNLTQANLWLTVGIGLTLLVGYWYSNVNDQIQAIDHQNVAQQQDQQPKLVKQSSADLQKQQGEQKAVITALAELAIPWDGLFAMLESLGSSQVRIMQIDPNPRQHRLRLAAQATDAATMLAYIHDLSQQRQLKDVLLLTHEHSDDGRAMPYSFVIEATWRN